MTLNGLFKSAEVVHHGAVVAVRISVDVPCGGSAVAEDLVDQLVHGEYAEPMNKVAVSGSDGKPSGHTHFERPAGSKRITKTFHEEAVVLSLSADLVKEWRSIEAPPAKLTDSDPTPMVLPTAEELSHK